MARIFEVVTPEQVAIRYELAGFGSRALAALIDTVLQGLIIAAIFTLLAIVQANGVVNFGIHSWAEMATSIVVGIFLLAWFIITWGYHIAFETLWSGETPGKRVMRLRVVRDTGHPVDFRAVVIRNLVRAVDSLPPLLIIPSYGFAFISVVLNPHYKRLGDMAAGTLVVRHGQDDVDDDDFTFGKTVVFRLLDPSVLSHLSRLTREEFRLAQRFLERRAQLPGALRAEFAKRLATPLMQKVAYQMPLGGVDYERWLDELDLAYRTRYLGSAAVSTKPAEEPTPAPVAAPRPVAPPEPDDERRW